MLNLIEDAGSKRAAQKRLSTIIADQLDRVGQRRIGFPSGARDEVVYSAGEENLWCTFRSAEDAAIPRSWNAFGVFHSARRALNITVEINVPTKSNSKSVAGFLARDAATGREYLMHDGSIGGGKKDVGRGAYLAWSKTPLELVVTSTGEEREGIVICDVDGPDAPDRIWRFVQSVRKFKDAAKDGTLAKAPFRRQFAEYERYRREFSGQKTGSRRTAIDYISYHGDVVDALRIERKAIATPSEDVFNTQLIDLYVKDGDRISEVFEVKSRFDRQSIYTAIGQLVTHAPDKDTARFLVLPRGPIADDLLAAIEANSITIRRYEITGKKRTVTMLSP